MMKLKNSQDITALLAAVNTCEGDVVILRRGENNETKEEYNLKSLVAMIKGVAQLLGENSEEYELWCMNKRDEPKMLQYYHEKYQEEVANAEA